MLGLVAIFIALSGTAYANLKIGPSDIERNAVRAGHIAKKHVRAKHLARNAVRSPHLAKRAVRPRHLLPGAVKGWGIATGAITADKLSTDVAGSLTPDPTVVDGRAMEGDLTGVFPNPEIAEGAVTSSKIAGGAVGSGQMDDDAVTSEKLASDSLRSRHFSSSGRQEITPFGEPVLNSGSCYSYIFTTGPGGAVGMATLAPDTEVGIVVSTSYRPNGDILFRVCNLTSSTLPLPAYFDYVVLTL